MKTKEIRDLIEFISQTGLNEVNIETEELKLSVKREAEVSAKLLESLKSAAPAQQAPAAPAPAAPAPAPVNAPANAEATAPAKSDEAGNYIEIKSPMIGTFYRAGSPESPPLASVGDKVEKGQAVCIIEAMKLFNEIESEVSGTIVKVMVDNASPVEYDQVLFLVDPS
ncbi:MAG: acetyl-CoA carboxylase biotin carboxyl carrier protein [Candidatus Cyclobacteriaceae bacterium M2_1C_046]